jgi:hypothetical protein
MAGAPRPGGHRPPNPMDTERYHDRLPLLAEGKEFPYITFAGDAIALETSSDHQQADQQSTNDDPRSRPNRAPPESGGRTCLQGRG